MYYELYGKLSIYPFFIYVVTYSRCLLVGLLAGRYKGMLWINSEPNRLLFQGVQRLYSADWDRPWGEETPRSVMVFIGMQLPEEEIRAEFAGLKK